MIRCNSAFIRANLSATGRFASNNGVNSVYPRKPARPAGGSASNITHQPRFVCSTSLSFSYPAQSLFPGYTCHIPQPAHSHLRLPICRCMDYRCILPVANIYFLGLLKMPCNRYTCVGTHSPCKHQSRLFLCATIFEIQEDSPHPLCSYCLCFRNDTSC